MFFLILGVLVVLGAIFYPAPGRLIQTSTDYSGNVKEKKDVTTAWRRILRSKRTRAVGIVLGVVLAFVSTLTTVPAQNVGVETSFGRVTGRNVDPGLNFKLPWNKVTDMDGTIQLTDNLGPDGRTAVRLNNNSVMYVENSLRWKIIPNAAPDLFQGWRGSGNIVVERVGPGLVERQLAAAINTALAPYDPLTPGAPGQTTTDISADVVKQLNAQIGSQVQIISFTVIRVDFDDATQARIVNVQEEVARTRAAEQSVKTAAQQKLANEKLASSVSAPGVLQSRCLDIQARAVEKGQSLAGAPSCFGTSQSSIVTQTPR